MSTQPQHLLALQAANKHRLERARIRKAVREAPVTDAREHLAVLLRDPPRSLHTTYVLHVLTWPRHAQQRIVDRWMHRAAVPPTTTVGELTSRQAHALALCLRGRQDHVFHPFDPDADE